MLLPLLEGADESFGGMPVGSY